MGWLDDFLSVQVRRVGAIVARLGGPTGAGVNLSSAFSAVYNPATGDVDVDVIGGGGATGAAGRSAVTTLGAFTMPSVNGWTTGTTIVDDTIFTAGQSVYVAGAGHMSVKDVGTGTVDLINTGAPGNTSPSTSIGAGALIEPSGPRGPAGSAGATGATGTTGATGATGASEVRSWSSTAYTTAAYSAVPQQFLICDLSLGVYSVALPPASSVPEGTACGFKAQGSTSIFDVVTLVASTLAGDGLPDYIGTGTDTTLQLGIGAFDYSATLVSDGEHAWLRQDSIAPAVSLGVSTYGECHVTAGRFLTIQSFGGGVGIYAYGGGDMLLSAEGMIAMGSTTSAITVSAHTALSMFAGTALNAYSDTMLFQASTSIRLGAPVTFDSFLDLAPEAVPAPPPSGKWRVFVDSADGKLKALHSGGTLVVLASII